jgi:ABC-type antimicrobial peptide transport system permease subunit
MALGARRADVVFLMVRGGLRLALIGVTIGFAGAFALGRAFHSTLYGISSVDYASLSAVAAVLLSVAVFASWVPARRAAHVDPMVALRDQ